jgi:predicted nucleic acid-binding protein
MTVEFCDTNVLLYAYDSTAPTEKRQRAQALVSRLWTTRSGCLSTQVLSECYVNLRRRLGDPALARAIVAPYAFWTVVVLEAADVLAAMERVERFQLSFWDALIVEAALKAHAEVLWTEDLNSGQRFDRLRVLNPFGEPQPL